MTFTDKLIGALVWSTIRSMDYMKGCSADCEWMTLVQVDLAQLRSPAAHGMGAWQQIIRVNVTGFVSL